MSTILYHDGTMVYLSGNTDIISVRGEKRAWRTTKASPAKQKLTQTQAAEKLGLSRVNYNRYENNEREPDNDTLIKIADFFAVTTDYLLGRTDSPAPEITPATNPPDPMEKLPEDAKKSIDDFKRYVLDKYGIKNE